MISARAFSRASCQTLRPIRSCPEPAFVRRQLSTLLAPQACADTLLCHAWVRSRLCCAQYRGGGLAVPMLGKIRAVSCLGLFWQQGAAVRSTRQVAFSQVGSSEKDLYSHGQGMCALKKRGSSECSFSPHWGALFWGRSSLRGSSAQITPLHLRCPLPLWDSSEHGFFEAALVWAVSFAGLTWVLLIGGGCLFFFGITEYLSGISKYGRPVSAQSGLGRLLVGVVVLAIAGANYLLARTCFPPDRTRL